MGRVSTISPTNICQASEDLSTLAVKSVKAQDLSPEAGGLAVSLHAGIALRSGGRLWLFGAVC